MSTVFGIVFSIKYFYTINVIDNYILNDQII